MKKLISVLMVGCILFSVSCTGPFKLTKRVHKWQTSFENKWVDEVAFLGCVILPVYSLSTLGDAIIFNSIEFWTGDNPMDESTVQLEEDGKTVEMALQDDGSIRVSDGQKVFSLERTSNGVTATDADGDVIYRAVKDENDQVCVYNASGELVKKSN